jgi:hypothetical protein
MPADTARKLGCYTNACLRFVQKLCFALLLMCCRQEEIKDLEHQLAKMLM